MTNSLSYTQFFPLGDQCIVARFGDDISEQTNQQVILFTHLVDESGIRGVVEVVPAYAEVAVYYDALAVSYNEIECVLRKLVDGIASKPCVQRDIVRVPVCYGGQYGPDIKYVAEYNGISVDQVVQMHTSLPLPVYMLGFTPGFCYLGDMPEEISCPRRETPRLSIPAGAVGIAGQQTGIYPLETPGGWQLIGRTPLNLFDAQRTPSTLVQAGEAIQFYAIDETEYENIKESQTEERYV